MKIQRVEVENYRSIHKLSWEPADVEILVGEGATDLGLALARLADTTRGWAALGAALSAERVERRPFWEAAVVEQRWRVVCAPADYDEQGFSAECIVARNDLGQWEVVFERIARTPAYDDEEDEVLLLREGMGVEWWPTPKQKESSRPWATGFGKKAGAAKRERGAVAVDMPALGVVTAMRSDKKTARYVTAMSEWVRLEGSDPEVHARLERVLRDPDAPWLVWVEGAGEGLADEAAESLAERVLALGERSRVVVSNPGAALGRALARHVGRLAAEAAAQSSPPPAEAPAAGAEGPTPAPKFRVRASRFETREGAAALGPLAPDELSGIFSGR